MIVDDIPPFPQPLSMTADREARDKCVLLTLFYRGTDDPDDKLFRAYFEIDALRVKLEAVRKLANVSLELNRAMHTRIEIALEHSAGKT